MHIQSPEWILWNVFLAAVPVAAGYLLALWMGHRKRMPWPLWALVWLPLAVVWLAFLPNTCYLLTEWRHFLFDPRYSPLRDLSDDSPRAQLHIARLGLFYMVYSGVGVFCYTLSIRPVESALRNARVHLALVAPFFFFFVSLGVYMGLIVRLNSWQIVTEPGLVWQTVVRAITTPLLLKVIVTFAFLLWLLYEMVDIWVDGLALRLKRGGLPEGKGKHRAKS